ncbi:hypothetical protein V1519DRAFT_451705 [Lipomyces tetrasporus]
MPIPTSERFNAGESLTPSPVIATNFFLRRRASTTCTFVCGTQRAIASGSTGRVSSSASLMRSTCAAVITMAEMTSGANMCTSLGIIPT